MGRTAIISIDGHVKAPRADYRRYVEARHLDDFDAWLRAAEGSGAPDAGNLDPALGVDAQWDAQRRVRDLETQNVVGEVLFPNGVPFQVHAMSDSAQARNPELTRAGARAYNRWLAEFCGEAPGRFKGQALVEFDDVEQAVADVHWAKENGLGGIMMPGLYPGGTFFFDPVLDPVWAAIEETGLPISQHGGTGVPSYSPPGLAAILTLAHEHSFYSARSLWQLILGGVFDRFPGLRLVFVETEVWWIGPTLQHLDERLKRGDGWTEFAAYLERERHFSRLPSEYWTTNCYAGVSPFHPAQLPFAKLGTDYEPTPTEFAIRGDNTMVGVDYPHFESIYPDTRQHVDGLLDQPTVTAADARRILFDNAADVYDFDRATLQPHVDRVGIDLPAPGYRRTTRGRA